jgi:hypothetical protein
MFMFDSLLQWSAAVTSNQLYLTSVTYSRRAHLYGLKRRIKYSNNNMKQKSSPHFYKEEHGDHGIAMDKELAK